jgi:hypothetical protein
MTRNTRRLAVASLTLGLGLAGPAAMAADGSGLADIFAFGDVDRVVNEDLPTITGDIEGGLGSLLGGDSGGLLGEILGGTGGLLDGLLGGLGGGLGAGLGVVPDHELSIQPIEPIGDGERLEDPKVAGGLLDGLLGLGSITDSLAGRL